ncbi:PROLYLCARBOXYPEPTIDASE-LIKE PROTEIN-RELATED [Salix purpurea]|uniref:PROLYLCARBOXYPEPTIDASE-LIKE PROTEIN-RELATED n=1 Tax=Salix purpurea TaxID=77065 RepID=A0A9Q0SW34_SALPP|nr:PROLYLCARBOXYPEPTIDASE-LIKE PROTEIN-RELATED [Salix purpurea]
MDLLIQLDFSLIPLFISSLSWHMLSMHRYYGESIPFGEEALKNASTLGYFNSAQAIADYAEIIIDIKKTFQAENAPVIVIGGSYGGMLASWLRLKYPHIATGSLF